MTQTTLSYRTNRDLFSNYYLDEYLPETESWDEVSDERLQSAYEEIKSLWDREKSTAPDRNESQLEEKFIRPMFRKLGIPFEVEESTAGTQRRPDYGFFETDGVARDAFKRRERGGNFYENAIAVADAKRWGRALDTRGSGENRRDFENPSYQIHVYLQETPTRWAVLTNGKQWRLYYGPTSHRLDSYYEVDLPTILEQGDMKAFKYFYLFFRQEAFTEDATDKCFLDNVYDESNTFAQELGEDLQENIYEAIKVLSEGFVQYSDNDLDEADLDLIHDSSLIYLYRIIFVLYAEAEGRDLLDTGNEIYQRSYSLNSLKQNVAEELDSGTPKYLDWRDNLWSRLDELFKLIDQGSESRGIPEKDLYIPAYNGGLFRTQVDESGSDEAQFLANHRVGDSYLARVIELLTRSSQTDSGDKIFVDYSSLDVRNLGSVYEGLLEYQLNVADEQLALNDNGEYVSADDEDEVIVKENEVYLTTNSGERKATGSYYTPEYVVEYIVENTIGPLVEDIRMELAGQSGFGEGGFAEEFAERVFELKILDPAMGSGHFLTSAVDYLSREIIDAQEKQANQQGVETVSQNHDINWARRQVVQRCIYGVDINPLAVELSKVSLWLRTLAAEQPLAFLDHHLKIGNSLIGNDIEDVLSNGKSKAEEGQLTLQRSFEQARRQTLEHIMDRFQDLLSIDNESLEDIKEMEAAFDGVRDDPLYQHLLAMTNVHTAEDFGLNIPEDAFIQMAEALRNESWSEIEEQDWFRSAQAMAEKEKFFHWELEYPVAFYGSDGERLDNAGFDAVIGNPPWVSFGLRDAGEAPEELADYLRESYPESAQYKFSTYAIFMDRAISLCRQGGLQSFITPDSYLLGQYFEQVRKKLLYGTKIREITLILEDFWREATTGRNTIYTIRKGKISDQNTMEINVAETLEDFREGNARGTRYGQEYFETRPLHRFHLFFDDIQKSLIEKIESNATGVLNDDLNINTGMRSRTSQSDIKSDKNVGPKWKRGIVSSGQVHPYYVSYEGHYLHRNETKLFSGGWDPNVVEQDEKMLIRQTGDRIIASNDDEQLYHLNNSHSAVTREDVELPVMFYTSYLNSNLLFAYYILTTLEYGRAMAQTDIETLEKLPLQSYESYDSLSEREKEKLLNGRYEDSISNHKVPSALAILGSRRKELTRERKQFNISLINYLGEYTEGPKLPDIGLFQPASSDILDSTTEKYEKLRVGKVKTERDGNRVIISVTARYKPENEDDHKTDRWGYTETGYNRAFILNSLDEKQAILIKEFVPVVIEEAGGFAGFRENATKTNSPIDRLKSITIPDPGDVDEDFQRYLDVKQRVEKLNEQIETTDQLINKIVYNLYDLTDDEIKIVESTIHDDY